MEGMKWDKKNMNSNKYKRQLNFQNNKIMNSIMKELIVKIMVMTSIRIRTQNCKIIIIRHKINFIA